MKVEKSGRTLRYLLRGRFQRYERKIPWLAQSVELSDTMDIVDIAEN